jgi:uncharacterized protein YkwD
MIRHAIAAALLMLLALPAPAQKKPDLEAVERAVLAGTNALRRERDLPALKSNEQLALAAGRFAKYMAMRDDYGHEADGRKPVHRARAAGYRDCMVTENISYQMHTRGFDTKELAERLVSGWFNSPGHRRNMLDHEVVDLGVGVAYSDETQRYYAVQLFGRPESMRLAFSVRNESRDDIRYRVGDKDWTIPARAERRHEICQEMKLVFPRRGGERTFALNDGDRFTIGPSGRIEEARR